MKIQVVFDVQGPVKELEFANYLAEMLELPQEDEDIYNIKSVDDVKILPAGEART